MELLKDCLESSGSDSEEDSGIVQGRVEGGKKKTGKSTSPKKFLASPDKKEKIKEPEVQPKVTRNRAFHIHALQGDGDGIGLHKSGELDEDDFSELS